MRLEDIVTLRVLGAEDAVLNLQQLESLSNNDGGDFVCRLRCWEQKSYVD
jgi:hypothetical protein